MMYALTCLLASASNMLQVHAVPAICCVPGRKTHARSTLRCGLDAGMSRISCSLASCRALRSDSAGHRDWPDAYAPDPSRLGPRSPAVVTHDAWAAGGQPRGPRAPLLQGAPVPLVCRSTPVARPSRFRAARPSSMARVSSSPSASAQLITMSARLARSRTICAA